MFLGLIQVVALGLDSHVIPWMYMNVELHVSYMHRSIIIILKISLLRMVIWAVSYFFSTLTYVRVQFTVGVQHVLGGDWLHCGVGGCAALPSSWPEVWKPALGKQALLFVPCTTVHGEPLHCCLRGVKYCLFMVHFLENSPWAAFSTFLSHLCFLWNSCFLAHLKFLIFVYFILIHRKSVPLRCVCCVAQCLRRFLPFSFKD